nr:MAG TPA: Tail fiber protein [Crassvirales sp.]
MSKEKYIGEAALKDKPGKKLTLVIKDGSVTTTKIADENVTTEKVANEAVTTPKIAEQAITDSKLGDSAVVERVIDEGAVTTSKIASGAVETDKIANENVTSEKLAVDSVTTSKIKNESVTTEKLAESSVETSKIKNEAITNDKVAKDSLTKDKFDPELRKALDAATGLPDELVTMIQDVDKNLAKLNDTVYPIILGFTITQNVGTMQTEVKYSVSSDGKAFMPDTLQISKQANDGLFKVLTNTPSTSGTLSDAIEGAREIFRFEVTKKGRTGKSTSQTRYLCYFGGNPAATMTAEILNTLSKVSATGVSFNPSITTKDNDYIWLVVPSYLSISRVTSAGFDVPLSTSQAITNSLGNFKAYRTINPLTTNSWNLVIS